MIKKFTIETDVIMGTGEGIYTLMEHNRVVLTLYKGASKQCPSERKKVYLAGRYISRHGLMRRTKNS